MVLIRYLTIDDTNSGLKLEKYILKHINNYNYIFIQKLIRSGQLRVNKKRVKLGHNLQTGDIVRIPFFNANSANENSNKNSTVERSVKFFPKERILLDYLNSNILYQDNHIIAINKPKGLAVQGGKGVRISLDKLLPYIKINRENKSNLSGVQKELSYNDNLKIVHRLDKETSGILLLAKTNAAAKWLFTQFKEQKVKKTYLCLVQGKVNSSGIINAGLLKINNIANKVIIDNINGKTAVTEYKSLGVSANTYEGKEKYNISYLQVMPKSGRNHQIRAHLGLVLKAPILGDIKYGFTAMELPFILLKSQIFLHAYQIAFNNLDNKKVIVTAHINAEWQNCLDALRLGNIKI